MQPEEIEQFVSVQRIPFPEEMPTLLQDFISALTYYDISFRKNKNNPNRRWTYEEVLKWLNGEPLVIPGEGVGNVGKGAMPAYQFLGESYTDPALLVAAFAKNWEAGKKQLFRGYITAHFRTYNQDIARKCQAAEEEAGRENGRDDIIFWRLLYQINPKLKGFYWKDHTYESLPAFGRDVLEKLWDRDHSEFSYYASILEEKLLTQYVLHAQPKNEKLKNEERSLNNTLRRLHWRDDGGRDASCSKCGNRTNDGERSGKLNDAWRKRSFKRRHGYSFFLCRRGLRCREKCRNELRYADRAV